MSHLCCKDKPFSYNFSVMNSQVSSKVKKVVKMENTQHFSPPPGITKCAWYHVSLYNYWNLTLKIELIFFLGSLSVLNILLHLWLTNPQVCSYSAAKPIQQWVPASERTHVLPSPPAISLPNIQPHRELPRPFNQQKTPPTGSAWTSGKQILIERRRCSSGTEKGFHWLLH